ncbi:hypothetical protein VCHA44O286_40237 [Vibrio chagasii]|nr:hypothetical protein VCHA44O286_40237 [Vibrio chagasii]
MGRVWSYGHAPNSSHPVSPVPITGAFCFWVSDGGGREAIVVAKGIRSYTLDLRPFTVSTFLRPFTVSTFLRLAASFFLNLSPGRSIKKYEMSAHMNTRTMLIGQVAYHSRVQEFKKGSCHRYSE